mgnify:CR=1 FL=1
MSSNLVLLTKSGYSYGPYLDQKINKTKNKVVNTNSDNRKMLSLLSRSRVDYFFIAPEEARALIKKSSESIDQFSLLEFKTLSNSIKRYLICSKKVDLKVIKLLNKHIPNI